MSEHTHRTPNRLAQETSPYLQQHAYNPVDWYPWGTEAFDRARELDVPIFLSIGYSACHWCHVMEHESFENDDIAAVMNDHFINIKVDREERPDVDQIYMNAVLALTGRGGWPMSMFLTPDLKPFFGGTYWPPSARMGMPGFKDILLRVYEIWGYRRDDLNRGADELTNSVQQMGRIGSPAAELNLDTLRHAERSLIRSTDRQHGGFGGAPKFPHSMDLRVMLRCWKRFQNSEVLELARLTLDKMAAGGIYDHLGGGFHRYATDARWLIPHFEKMLYDNALLVPTYLEAWQITGNARDREVITETLDYVVREMTQPGGGFYSTQDADSEGVEGKFFVWDQTEIETILGEEADVFCSCYDVSAPGNWEHKNILERVLDDEAAAKLFLRTPEEIRESLHRSRQKLFDARKLRIAPGRDDKILASWNGLMLSAMSRAAFALDRDDYLTVATTAADFVLTKLRNPQGRLMHGWKDGRAQHPACLDDYSHLIDGLIELFLAGGKTKYLDEAVKLSEEMLQRFRDAESGALFFTADDHESLIARNLDTQDGATPSGNSVAATALIKLGRITSRPEFEQVAEGILNALSGQINRTPLAGGQALIAFDLTQPPAFEAVFFPGKENSSNEEVRNLFRQRFLPGVQFLEARDEHSKAELLEAHLCNRQSENGEPTLYLCERGRCELPLVGVEAIRRRVEKL